MHPSIGRLGPLIRSGATDVRGIYIHDAAIVYINNRLLQQATGIVVDKSRGSGKCYGTGGPVGSSIRLHAAKD